MFRFLLISFLSSCSLTQHSSAVLNEHMRNMFQHPHNLFRVKNTLAPLVWSKDLERMAEKHVESIARSCWLSDYPNKFPTNKELVWGSQSPTPKQVVHSWIDQRLHWDARTKKCDSGKHCDEYRLLADPGLREIGCSVGGCEDPWSFAVSAIYVCKYD